MDTGQVKAAIASVEYTPAAEKTDGKNKGKKGAAKDSEGMKFKEKGK